MTVEMKHKSKILLTVGTLVILLSGCASNVKRTSGFSAPAYTLSESRKVSEVTISMTRKAKEKSAKNLKFDPEVLRKHVKRALNSHSVLDPEMTETLPYVEIQVTNMRIRSNFSAIVFGVMAGADSISGDIIVKSRDGKELDRFEVSASYALGGFGGGQDDARMGWLYETFAKQTANELLKIKSGKK